jgi:hypothetical protein
MTPEEKLQKLWETRWTLEQMVRENRMPHDVWDDIRPQLEAAILEARGRAH